MCHSLSVFSAENSREEEKEEDRSKFAMFECTCVCMLCCVQHCHNGGHLVCPMSTQPSTSDLPRVAISIPGIPREARLSISGGDTDRLHRPPRSREVHPETPPGI